MSRLLLPLSLLAALGMAALPVRVSAESPGAPTFANVRVSHDTAQAHSEPAIAENPADPSNLVAGSKFFPTPADVTHYRFKIGTFYSRDGGQTWHDDGVLPGFQNFYRTSDISFAFSPNGSLVYACVLAHTADGKQSGIFVSRSHDGGATWSKPFTVFLDSTGATFSDKPWIAVDATKGPNRAHVYVAWNLDGASAARNDNHLTRAGASGPRVGVVVSHSSDYGRTWSAPRTISPFNNKHDAIGAIPAVAPNGHVSVAYLAMTDSSGSEVDSMKLQTSTNGGRTFSSPVTIANHISSLPNHLGRTTFRNLSLPTFAISPKDGSMVLAWADMRYGDADILAARSRNNGKTWSRPVRVNDDPLHDGKDQFQPALAVAPDGVFTCAWFDRRFDPTNIKIDEEIAQSTNDGQRFGANLRVTRASWDPAIDAPWSEGQKTNTFIGDYQALAVDNLNVHPLWNDTQNGSTQEIRSAALPEQVFQVAG